MYLSSLVPQTINHISNYSLRNSLNIHSIATRANLYNNSFLPSVIRDWNDLPIGTRQLNTVNTFKPHINRETFPVPKYYSEGNHKAQVLHTQLCTHCSSLNIGLFSKNITDPPLCSCGAVENVSPFFLSCPLYNVKRISLLNDVLNINQFLSICYFMGMLHFHMQLMPSYFRRYKSTYWILNNLLNNTALTIYTTCDGI